MLTMAVTGGSYEDTQSNEMGDGVSCDHAQSSDCLPRVVVRHFNA